MIFVDRAAELRYLEAFWASRRAECIPVLGRRRVGKTELLSRFAQTKRHVYYRCRLAHTEEQLPLLGAALAEISDDPFVHAQPPTTWEGIFTLVEQYANRERFLLVLDELPYWVARHDQVPSVLQNWWDARGRELNLMLVFCGSAVQMMENLLSGDAPLAGCPTGRLAVRPFTYVEAAHLLRFPNPTDTLAAYGILGGVPLYLSLFDPEDNLQVNIARRVVSPAARLYVEPHAVFAAHHTSFDREDALRVLGAIARGAHQWSRIEQRARMAGTSLARMLDLLMGDLALVQKVLPVTLDRATETTRTQYRLADNFFSFWFQFVEPQHGRIEFGGEDAVAASAMTRLNDYMAEPFEEICREWTRRAARAGAIEADAGRVGTWWTGNHQLDVVGLDSNDRVCLTGECKWQNGGFGYDDLTTYLGHVRSLDHEIVPDARHLLFSKTTFDPRVRAWADRAGVRLLTPADLLAPLPETAP